MSDKSASELTILAIPRGGVVTGDVVASRLGAKLDVIVSRKIGAPHNSELAVGAVMHDGSFYRNQDIISKLSLSQEYIDEHISIQRKEIDRRLMRFRGSNQYQLQGKSIILVDDGIATGATMFAIINWLEKQPIPVAEDTSGITTAETKNEFICVIHYCIRLTVNLYWYIPGKLVDLLMF